MTEKKGLEDASSLKPYPGNIDFLSVHSLDLFRVFSLRLR